MSRILSIIVMIGLLMVIGSEAIHNSQPPLPTEVLHINNPYVRRMTVHESKRLNLAADLSALHQMIGGLPRNSPLVAPEASKLFVLKPRAIVAAKPKPKAQPKPLVAGLDELLAPEYADFLESTDFI